MGEGDSGASPEKPTMRAMPGWNAGPTLQVVAAQKSTPTEGKSPHGAAWQLFRISTPSAATVAYLVDACSGESAAAHEVSDGASISQLGADDLVAPIAHAADAFVERGGAVTDRFDLVFVCHDASVAA